MLTTEETLTRAAASAPRSPALIHARRVLSYRVLDGDHSLARSDRVFDRGRSPVF